MGELRAARLLTDVVEQLEELSDLINDLIDLARGEEPSTARPRTSASTCWSRRSSHGPGATRRPARSRRAARADASSAACPAAWSAPSTTCSTTPSSTAQPVSRSRSPCGTGADRPRSRPGHLARRTAHVFDRFYRGAEARGRPGSGLGLAIVRQVAAQHGGSITAEPAPGGGTLMRLRLPGPKRPAPSPSWRRSTRSCSIRGRGPPPQPSPAGRPDSCSEVARVRARSGHRRPARSAAPGCSRPAGPRRRPGSTAGSAKELRGRPQAPGLEILAEGQLTELGIGPLQLRGELASVRASIGRAGLRR